MFYDTAFSTDTALKAFLLPRFVYSYEIGPIINKLRLLDPDDFQQSSNCVFFLKLFAHWCGEVRMLQPFNGAHTDD